mmetsp:Transcript_21505/g.43559  ORF Transcript_21505/g.43559 Transcript_21505/m.43559 type:complete len:92 (-) Transcript_21505:346-621(-)|eukprot:CAMPEP_0174696586 /NCGR_PEP_ID=MMETSP1094-20130205/2699_1 /TAXON_ID=156173 /ORGANISM="Chrysochromulina brevifilum, Strain UTEX LB 985" /LENGTH=91 /DNA_ID=CAMNT_0015893395 /DNA_START=33 /DNA_END=308 /DNA_ORIENTATION=-
MFRFLLVALLVALTSAFTAPLASKVGSSIVMNAAEATRDSASAIQQSQTTGQVVPTKKAPKSGWSLTMGGGTRTIEDVYADQKKAAKKYKF